MPDLSVVVAAQDAGPNLRKCLSALSPQLSPGRVEAVVAAGQATPTLDRVAAEFPSVRVLRLAPGTNVPQLWSAGIAATQGSVVALTIENCVPASDWAGQMLSAQAGHWPAVGGAIDIDPGASLVDWAVYFCRYSNYMRPFPPRFLEDLAGDNCSYKREVLEGTANLMGDGFWETFINSDIRRRRQPLLSDPAPVVTYCGGLSAWRFLVRRYRHGRYFAARRAGEFTRMQKLARAAGFLAVPPLLLIRIARRVWRHSRHRARFAAALPLIGCFLLAWSSGEAAGYLAGFPAGAPVKD